MNTKSFLLTKCAESESLRVEMNTTSSHTPGPWATDCDVPTFDGADLPYSVFIGSGPGKGGEICVMLHEPEEGRGSDWEEGRANARLIAAAPELLTELKAALPFIGYLPRDPQAIVDRIKAAIAKAEGRS